MHNCPFIDVSKEEVKEELLQAYQDLGTWNEVAKLYDVSVPTIKRWRTTGKYMKKVAIGPGTRFFIKELATKLWTAVEIAKRLDLSHQIVGKIIKELDLPSEIIRKRRLRLIQIKRENARG